MRSFIPIGLPVVLLAACGSVKSGSVADAPPAEDAGIDAVTRGTVSVRVLDASGTGAAAVGANVVFIDPDGTLVKRAATDSQGKASADVLPGASVTSVTLDDLQYQIQTVLRVKPGDDLVLGSKKGDFNAAGSFTVNYPAHRFATQYYIATPCGFAITSPPDTSFTFVLNNSCKQSPMEIVVTPVDANRMALNTISKANIPFVDGGTTTISGTYQAARVFTASYTNINPVIASIAMTRLVPDGQGAPATLSQETPPATQVLTVTGGTGTNARVVTRFIHTSQSYQEARQNLDGSAATYGLDVGAKLLPWILPASFDATTSKLVVPLDTTGTSTAKPDVFRAIANYSRVVNQTTTFFTWTVFSPEAGDLTLPSLPAEVGDVMPTASDSVSVSAAMLEADTISGYDAIRNNLNAAMALYTGFRPPAASVNYSSTPKLPPR